MIACQFGDATQCQQSSFTPSTPNTFHPRMQSVKATCANRLRWGSARRPGDCFHGGAKYSRFKEPPASDFDDLTETLRRYGCEVVAWQAVKDAEEHGYTRQRQGYELTEMLRKLKILRAVLIFHLRAFEDLNPEDGMAARLFTSTFMSFSMRWRFIPPKSIYGRI